jgi:hypothetical protein
MMSVHLPPVFSADVTPRRFNRIAAIQEVEIATISGGLGVGAEFSTISLLSLYAPSSRAQLFS